MKLFLFHLAGSAAGRITLHLACALRSHHWLFAWHGIIRELRRKRP